MKAKMGKWRYECATSGTGRQSPHAAVLRTLIELAVGIAAHSTVPLLLKAFLKIKLASAKEIVILVVA